MKSILITLLCVLLIASGGTCVAFCSDTGSAYLNNRAGVYLKGFGGLNLAHEPRWDHAKYRTSTGYVVGTALGYAFSLVSVEGEFSYRHNSIDRFTVDALDIHVDGDLEQWCGLGNVLLGIPITNCFAPYVGVGAGYRHSKPGVNFDESSDISFKTLVESSNEWGVYQAIGGLNFTLSRFVNLQLEYRYLDGFTDVRCSNHTVDLSAVIQF
ncbi:MAG TPA: outer membrane beta-barrel protein [Waddliaceae bacterium]